MSRLSLLTSAMSILALGAGAIGYAADARGGEAEVRPHPSGESPPSAPVQRRPDRIVTPAAGESLAELLLRSGVGGLDSALADMAAGEAPAPSRPLRLWLGERIGEGARLLERVEYRTPAGARMQLVRHSDQFLRTPQTDDGDDTPVRIRLAGGAALAGELAAAGLPTPLRTELLRKAAGQKVAALDLIVAHEEDEHGSLYGPPLYLGLHLEGGAVRRWMADGGRLSPVGVEAGGGGLLRPIPGPITSGPGLRVHPILRYLRLHRGTDFAAPSGTPVQAALGGTVLEAGWRGGYGRVVRIGHADGSVTLYAHLSDFDVAEGETVSQGAVIGRVGASGLATGPHLHFEWLRSGEVLAPSFAAPLADAGAMSPKRRAALQALLAAPYRQPPKGA